MNVMVLKKIAEFHPPFKLDVEHIQGWLNTITVVLKTNGEMVGGAVVGSGTIATVQFHEEKRVKILFKGKVQSASLIEGAETEMPISFYQTEPEPYVGLPNRKDMLDKESWLFSYEPISKAVFCYNLVPNTKSPADKISEKKRVDVEVSLHGTLPLVDRFGYFVGLGAGEVEGCVVAMQIKLNRAKL